MQTAPANETARARDFNAGVIWQTLRNLGESFLGQLPYILIGLAVFGVFLVAGRVTRSLIGAAGERTRLDTTLAELLGRLASFAIGDRKSVV